MKLLPATFLLLTLAAPALAQQVIPATADPRIHVPLTEWTFWRGDLTVEAVSANTSPPQGQNVTVPHTWNNLDGQDGGGNYFRGDGWYRRTLTITPDMAQRTRYLRFEGVNRRAEV